jgi:hypothetical protein
MIIRSFLGWVNTEMLNEKETIERETAEAFLRLYNSQFDSSYSIVEHSDAPDFLCREKNSHELKLEITLTEDRPGDIQGALGRSDAGSFEAQKARLQAVKEGKASIFDLVSCLQGNVLLMIVGRIQAKLKKHYGRHAALVVRDASPIPWDWDCVLGDIHDSLDLRHNPFDEGIWIISFAKNEIYRVV